MRTRSPYLYIIIIAIIVVGGLGFYKLYQTANRLPENEIEDIQEDTNSSPAKETIPPSTPSDNEETAPITPSQDKDNSTPLSFVNHAVPFTSQAPTGQWDDDRQQDGCEEASALMAMAWVKGETLTSQKALEEILAISDYEQATYGEYRDVSLTDVENWIFKDYFKYTKVKRVDHITANDIIKALQGGGVVLLPLNGQKLGNPNFTPPGPERHMLLVRGYDPKTQEFITNDPGTRKGSGYRYSVMTIMESILVYPTGHHEPADAGLKSMLVVTK